ncbi:hypothetical protein HWV62_25148 [Athelia sp. TMB]|nr:hypothetical protein HWV62_25148 [Athelia sp. TMB]
MTSGGKKKVPASQTSVSAKAKGDTVAKAKAPKAKPSAPPAPPVHRTRASRLAEVEDIDKDLPDKEVSEPEKKSRKRRTPAQLAEAKAAEDEARAAKTAKLQLGLQRIAEKENTLLREDANLITPRTVPTSSTRSITKVSVPDFEEPASELTKTTPSDTESQSEYHEDAEIDDEPVPVAAKKTKATSKHVKQAAEETEEDSDIEMTPIVKKGKAKVQGNRVAIESLRRAENADLDQKNVKQLAPKEELSNAPKIKTGAIDRWIAAAAPPRRHVSSKASTISASVASRSSLASRRVVASSTLTDDITISADIPIKAEPVEASDFSMGGLQDEDETQGAEHDAAASSPVKGKNRKDSHDIIEIDDTPMPMRTQARKKEGETSSKTRNDDLPAGVLDDGRWLKVFVLTVVQVLSSFINPWSVPDKTMKKVLQAVFNVVYAGRVDHTVVVGDPVWRVSAQRLTEYRSKMGSAGLAIINSLLDSETGSNIPADERLFDTDEKRSEYCRDLLEDEQFAYANYRSPKKKNGVFAGPLILRTLAVYFTSIEGAVKVRALKDLIQRALMLWADGAINMALWQDAKDKNRGEILNKNFIRTSTSNKTDNKFKFDEIGYGEETAYYAEDAADLDAKDLIRKISFCLKFAYMHLYVLLARISG